MIFTERHSEFKPVVTETPSAHILVLVETPSSEHVETPGPEEPSKKEPNKYPPPDLLLEKYNTLAVREETCRHDQVIVESAANFGSMTANDIAEMNAVGKMVNASELCITIFASNRQMPYLDALLVMLLKGRRLQRDSCPLLNSIY
uniref:Uncharacterized protein n=1 Tax=Pseudo-nitzschia australis TaxID=44445 RepID=A0A6V0CAN8_9STRA